MKKSLIALATLSACAAQAAAAAKKEGLTKLKPSENDDALALAPKIDEEEHIKPGMANDERYIKPIVTREMLAGAQPMLDKRPIHIPAPLRRSVAQAAALA